MGIADDLHRAWTDGLRDADREFDVSSAHEQRSTNAVVHRMRATGVSLGGRRLLGDAPRCGYAGGKCRGDARLVLDDGSHVLVEAKWYWKSWWVDRSAEKKARTYLFAPLEGRDDKSAVLDLTKLARLRDGSDPARHAALVIVAHSRPPHAASADLDELGQRGLLNRGPWESALHNVDGRWPSPRWSGYEYDVRVFTCSTERLGGWWSSFEPLVRAAGWAG